MVEVKMKNRKGYKLPVEKAVKLLKRKMEDEGVFDELKERRHFVSKSEKRRLAKKRADANRRRQYNGG